MFEEFVLPEIRQMCKDLDRTMYHLDGVGQLNHLDMLLGIKELDAVQWVPGSNAVPHNQWPEVWRKIQAAGKNMQINVPFLNYLDDVIDQIGTGKGIHLEPVVKNIAEKESVLDILKGYGITS